jgi:hypothetical protein
LFLPSLLRFNDSTMPVRLGLIGNLGFDKFGQKNE